MSQNKRLRNQASSGLTGLELNGGTAGSEISQTPSAADKPAGGLKERILTALRGRWWVVGLVAVLALSALGGTLKYLEQDAARVTAERQRLGYLKKPEESALAKINPFLANPTTTPAPQLSKEYIYAGQRMLAVEDKSANPAVPVDLAVYRPTGNTWLVMGPGSTLASSNGWGASGDLPVPGDYDGDGKTDLAVFRPSNDTWYIVRSSDGSYLFQGFGSYNGEGDRLVPADYDGDHRTDIAVYRPSNFTWYILRSSDSTLEYRSYGATGDLPAPADYDGDGKADAAVLRPSDSTVYVQRTIDGATQAGQLSTSITSGQQPVPGDYDGDGKADYAMRSGDDWLIRLSSTGALQTVTWYSGGDTAVQSDYDGDGKCDIAVWKSTGYWYIRQSKYLGQSNELRTEGWGQAGDVPVPALWRR